MCSLHPTMCSNCVREKNRSVLILNIHYHFKTCKCKQSVLVSHAKAKTHTEKYSLVETLQGIPQPLLIILFGAHWAARN